MHHIRATFDKIVHALNDVLQGKPPVLRDRVRPGPKHRFTDFDVIALSLTADVIGLNSENHLFAVLCSDYKDQFPTLLSRRQFNYRKGQLADEINLFAECIRDKFKKPRKTQDIYVVDSMPLRLCRKARHQRSTICKDNPDLTPNLAWCAAQDEWYYGVKLNLVCSGEGVIQTFKVGESRNHDIRYLPDIVEDFQGCIIVGDKGYISKIKAKKYFDAYKVRIETPLKRNQKGKIFIYGKVRKRIETLFSQLNDQFKMQENYAKSMKNYLARINSKLCTITLMQYINNSKNKPVSKVKYALI